MLTIKIILLYSFCSLSYADDGMVCGFNTNDEAAKSGLESIYNQSHDEKVEYGGCVKKQNNEYCYFGINTDHKSDRVSNECSINDDAVSDFHTHVYLPNHTNEEFSYGKTSDISSEKSIMSINKNYEYAYLATASGRILRFDGNNVDEIGSIRNDQYASNDQSEIQNDGNINEDRKQNSDNLDAENKEENTNEENCGFKTLDSAAEAGLNEIYESSMNEKIEYGGCLSKKEYRNFCFYGIVTQHKNKSVEIDCLNSHLGRFHTHTTSNDNEINEPEHFSPADINNFNEMNENTAAIAYYLATDGGKILKLTKGENIRQIGEIRSKPIGKNSSDHNKNNDLSKGQWLFAGLFALVFGYFILG